MFKNLFTFNKKLILNLVNYLIKFMNFETFIIDLSNKKR
jgi:hypothetical protein